MKFRQKPQITPADIAILLGFSRESATEYNVNDVGMIRKSGTIEIIIPKEIEDTLDEPTKAEIKALVDEELGPNDEIKE